MGTDTSEYTRPERRGAKKTMRHPLYQQMRQRALKAETETNTVRQDLKKQLAEAIDKGDKDGKALMKTREELAAQVAISEGLKKELDDKEENEEKTDG